MKKVLLTSCIAAISSATSAGVFLPNIGVDGWNSDSQFYRGQAFSQGYLTAAKVKNHTINPAFALDLMESAEARMDENGNFGAGVFSQLFGQNVGVYFGRPTDDDELYMLDTDFDGETDTGLGFDGDSDGYSITDPDDTSFPSPTSILDAYWAANLGLGKVGVRLNYRASGYEENRQVNSDNVEETLSGSLKEFNTTVGLVSNSMPLEATFTLGIPFGELTYTQKDNNADTKDQFKGEIAKGLRWGTTVKYTLTDSARSTNVVSTFVGSSAANYDVSDKDTAAGTTNVNYDRSAIQEKFTMGLVGSHEKVINNRTRLVASASLYRTSTEIGTEDNLASPSAPRYEKSVTYRLPVAIGVEFRKSEKTELIGSVTSDLFYMQGDAYYTNVGGDSEETLNMNSTWDSNNTQVEFGMAYQMTSRLNTSFVINKALFSTGLNSGLATLAEFTYKF